MEKKPLNIRMTALDRTIGFFSPIAAQKRLTARATIAHQLRLYDGADRGRNTSGWRAGSTAANSEIAAAGPLLRDRSRDLVRNNALAAQAIQVLVNNIVGTGIRPRAATGNKTLNKKVDKLWKDWASTCDAHGHTDIHGIVSLAVREMLEGGEVLAMRRPQYRSQDAVPLKIELFEPDHLDDGRQDNRTDGSRISQGIEYDRSGRRAAYWMFPDHPGDSTVQFVRALESVRIPADSIAHLFERQRVQSRGVPWGTPAMTALRDLGDWQVAEMVRKKTEACMVAVVLGEDNDGSSSVTETLTDSEGNTIEQFSPGMFAYMRGGKDVKFNTPGQAGGIAEWNRVQMYIISAGFRVPYALMSNDLSNANFSSNRAGLNEFRRMVEQVQWTVVIPMLCQRIWDWFTEAAFAAGMLPTPRVAVEWAPPKFEAVNPKQDAETDLIETRAGFATVSQNIAKRGYDPAEVFEERAKENKITDGLGLVLDSDPRKVSRAGQAQAEAAESEDEPPVDKTEKE